MFSFTDVLFLKVIGDLLKTGVEVSRLKTALKRARASAETWVNIRSSPKRFLVSDGTEVFIRQRGELESKTLNGQLAFAFVLDLQQSHRTIANDWPGQSKRKVYRVRRK